MRKAIKTLGAVLCFLAQLGVALAQSTFPPVTPWPATLDFTMACALGDSRSSQIQNGGAASNGYLSHWLVIFNALQGDPLRVGCSTGVLTLGFSGDRSDQFISLNGQAWLASPAGNLFLGPGCLNDVAQASGTPYTNVNGVAVTVSNVAAICEGNLAAEISAAIAKGHRVFAAADTGSTSLNSSQVPALLEANRRLRDFCTVTIGCNYFDYNAAVWNPTNSATALAFKTNYSSDGTHPSTLGNFAIALAFQQQYGALFPVLNKGICNIAETYTTSPLQLIFNPLFQTTTGGTFSGAGTLTSGTVAANWTLNLPTGLSVTVTYPADPNGCGNTMQLALVASAAGTAYAQSNAQAAANSALTDINQCYGEEQITSGSSNFSSYMVQNSAGNVNTNSSYSMFPFATGAYANFPTTALDLKFETYPATFQSGNASVSFVTCRIYFIFSAAGSATINLGRVDLHKRFTQP